VKRFGKIRFGMYRVLPSRIRRLPVCGTQCMRLKTLDLPSLELRRLYADLLWCYKIVFRVVDVTRDDFFQLCSTSITRSHMYKLYEPRCTNSKRSHFFACRIINVWNGLPLSMDFSSLNAFKRSIFKTDLSEYLI